MQGCCCALKKDIIPPHSIPSSILSASLPPALAEMVLLAHYGRAFGCCHYFDPQSLQIALPVVNGASLSRALITGIHAHTRDNSGGNLMDSLWPLSEAIASFPTMDSDSPTMDSDFPSH